MEMHPKWFSWLDPSVLGADIGPEVSSGAAGRDVQEAVRSGPAPSPSSCRQLRFWLMVLVIAHRGDSREHAGRRRVC